MFSQFFKGICICSHQFSETFRTQKDKYTPFLFSQNEKDPETLWSWAMIYSFWLFPFSFIEFLFFSTFSMPIQNTWSTLYPKHIHTHTHACTHTPLHLLFHFLLNLARCICDWKHLIKTTNMAGTDDLCITKSVDLQTEVLFDLSQMVKMFFSL